MIRRSLHKGISPGQEVIGRGTKVRVKSGEAGEIDHVLVDSETGEVRHLVLRIGSEPALPIVPQTSIEAIDGDTVTLNLTRGELDALPRYTPRDENDVLEELRERLADMEFDVGTIEAALSGGIVSLRGSVASVRARRQAEAASRSVVGVLDVDNALQIDTAVRARVTAALADDARTKLSVIDVISDRGLVTISGNVDTEEIREAAEEIAAAQDGVVSVINALEVRPDDITGTLAPGLLGGPYVGQWTTGQTLRL
jgi:osmotically-inducible protein OsmY